MKKETIKEAKIRLDKEYGDRTTEEIEQLGNDLYNQITWLLIPHHVMIRYEVLCLQLATTIYLHGIPIQKFIDKVFIYINELHKGKYRARYSYEKLKKYHALSNIKYTKKDHMKYIRAIRKKFRDYKKQLKKEIDEKRKK